MSRQKVASATKRFYVRGVADTLQRKGVTKIASLQNLNRAADHVAANVDFPEPVLYDDGELYLNPEFRKVAHQVAATVASAVIDVANNYVEQGVKEANYGRQTVYNDSSDLGGDIMSQIQFQMEHMVKEAMGASIESGNPAQQNSQPLSVQSEAQQDLARRPLNYAAGDMGVGVPMLSNAARVGTDMPHPGRESGVTGAASNKIEQANLAGREVTASIQETLRKMAAKGTGASVDSSDPSQRNDVTDSVQAEAKQDAARRPSSYAAGDLGIAVPNLPDAARDGMDGAHPGREGGVTGPGGSQTTAGNSANSTNKAAYARQIDSIVSQLPDELTTHQKIAEANAILRTDPALRQTYVNDLFRRLG